MAVVKLYPSIITPTNAWTNPDNAKLDDGVYAVTAGTRNVNHILTGTGFTHSIPVGSTINSVVAEAQYKLSTTASAWSGYLQVNVSGALSGTQTTFTTEPTVDTVATATGGSMTYADLANLGVQFQVRRTSNTACNYSVDYIAITITYTEPVYNVNGTIAVSDGIHQTSTTIKGAKCDIVDTNGVQQTLTYTRSKDATVGFVDTNGIQQTAEATKSGRSPPITDSIGDQTVVTGSKGIASVIVETGGYTPPESLVIHWSGEDFANDPPTTTLPDRSGNGLDGNVVNFTYDGVNNGASGDGGIIFSSDILDNIQTSANLTQNARAVEAVFKLNQVPVNWASVVSNYNYNGTTGGGLAFFVHSDGRLGIHYFDGPTRHYDLFSDVNFGQNIKYHCIVQYNEATGHLQFYKDGELVKNLYIPALTLDAYPARFNLGNWTGNTNYSSSYDFRGIVYEAKGYSEVLSQEEITATYESSMGLGVGSNELSLGIQMSVVGVAQLTTYDKTGTVLISDGIQQTAVVQKGSSTAIAITHGTQQSMTARKSSTHALTLTNGIQQSVANVKRGRSPSVTDTLGIQQSVLGTKSVIIARTGTVSVTNGVQQSMTARKGVGRTLTITNGLNQSVLISKGAKRSVSSTVGIQQSMTVKKGARKLVTVTHGIQMTMTGEKPSMSSVSINHGIQQSVTGVKKIRQAIATTNGTQQSIAFKKGAKRAFGVTNGTQQLTTARKASKGTVESSEGIRQFMTVATLVVVSKLGTVSMSNGINHSVEGSKRGIGAVQVSNGCLLSLSGRKASRVLLVSSVGIEQGLTSDKNTHTFINISNGLTIELQATSKKVYHVKRITRATVVTGGIFRSTTVVPQAMLFRREGPFTQTVIVNEPYKVVIEIEE